MEFGYDPTETPARWYFAWVDHREPLYDDYADVIATGVSRALSDDS